MLYIFDKNDALLEILENFFDDKMTRELNSDWTYTFKVDIKESQNLIKTNKIGFFIEKNFYLFTIEEIEDVLFSDDTKEVYCQHDYFSLNNHLIENKKCVDYTIEQSLQKALENTKYKVGNCDLFDNNTVTFYFISSLSALKKISETYKAEINPRIEYNSETNKLERYIDLCVKLGEETGLRFTYDTNLESIKRTTTINNHYNVLYGRGSSLAIEDESGEETGGYTRLIDFADVEWTVDAGNPCDKPLGQKFVEDVESIEKYGRIEGIYENKDITDSSELLEKTFEMLQETKELKVSYEVNVNDIKDVQGFEHYKYFIGDRVIILDEDYNINFESRIIKEELSIKDKTKIVTLGYILPSMSSNNTNNVIKSEDNQEENKDFTDEDFPNTLPNIPELRIDREGFASISLSWDYENKVYYTYELYASQLENFNPTENHIIWRGRGSAFLHEVNFDETWYYRIRVINTHGQSTDFSNEVSGTTYKIDDATEIFKKAAIKEALIESLNADKINAGKVKGTYIDARNLSVTDNSNNITFEVTSGGIVKIIQGLIEVTDEGIKINLVDSENTILGSVLYDGQGLQVFDVESNNPLAYFTREGSFIENLQANRIECSSLVQIINENNCPDIWYVSETVSGDGSGKDEDNKACSLQEVLNNIKKCGMYLNSDITIEVESGTIKENILLKNIFGATLNIKFKKGVSIECESINIENCLSLNLESETNGVLATDNSMTATEINSRCILKSDGDLFKIKNSTVNIQGFRIRGKESGCVATIDNSKVKIKDCDISNYNDIFNATELSICTIDNSRGNVDKLAMVDSATVFTSTSDIPNCSEMVSIEGSGIHHSKSSYTKFSTLYQEPTTPGTNTNTNTNSSSSFELTNLYTTVEGSGSSTSAKKGYLGQGRYSNYKAHRGHATIPVLDIISAMNSRENPILQIELTRLNTGHGYYGEVPHPIIRTAGNGTGQTSNYWDTEVKFARGAKKTITLDTSIVNGIKNGATELQFWAEANQATQYSFYNNISIKVIGNLIGNTGGSEIGSEVIATARVITANLNVRTGPGTSYNYIGVVSQGDIVEIVEKDAVTGWYKIKYNSTYGYISGNSDYTEIISGSI